MAGGIAVPVAAHRQFRPRIRRIGFKRRSTKIVGRSRTAHRLPAPRACSPERRRALRVGHRRALQDRDPRVDDVLVLSAVAVDRVVEPVLGLVVLVVLRALFEERQQQREAGDARQRRQARRANAGRQRFLGIDVVVHGQAELADVVLARCAPGGGPRGLNRRQQQRHQDADDRDHHQQLD